MGKVKVTAKGGKSGKRKLLARPRLKLVLHPRLNKNGEQRT